MLLLLLLLLRAGRDLSRCSTTGLTVHVKGAEGEKEKICKLKRKKNSPTSECNNNVQLWW